MARPLHYRVYELKYRLSLADPDAAERRFHAALFVETDADGGGFQHHVVGDVSTPRGMTYERAHTMRPELDRTLESKTLLGITNPSVYPGGWEELLRSLPAPPQQRALNRQTGRAELVKTLTPLVFYEPGEPQPRLVKCVEWTEQSAIPALQNAGLLCRSPSRVLSDDSFSRGL